MGRESFSNATAKRRNAQQRQCTDVRGNAMELKGGAPCSLELQWNSHVWQCNGME